MNDEVLTNAVTPSSPEALEVSTDHYAPRIGRYLPWLEYIDDELFNAPVILISPEEIQQISNLAVEERSSWPFGDLFPALGLDVPRRLFSTSVRLANVLDRVGVVDFADLAELTLRDAIGFRNMGAKSVDELLGLLIELALSEPTPPDLPFEGSQRAESGFTPEVSAIETRRSEILRGLSEDLEILSRWQSVRGRPAGSLLESTSADDGTPAHVIDASRRIRNITAADWSVTANDDESIGSLLNELIGELGDKDRMILNRRLATNHPETLDTLGNAFGLTRERIRQLEAKLKPQLQNWLDPRSALGLRAAALRQRISPVAHRSEVFRDIPVADGAVIDSDLPAWLFLDKIDEGFESDGDWLAVPSLEAVTTETRLRFEQICGPHGSAPSAQLFEVLLPWTGLSEERLEDWLTHSGYLRVGGGWALLGRRSITSFVAAYLEQSGEGTSVDEFNEAIPWEHSLNSLRNALISDDRFVSVARAEWELTSWGGTQYRGIKDAISSAIMLNEGVIALETLVNDLAIRLNVSENSVRTFANAWPFAVEKGLVRFATERKSRPRLPGLTRNVYLGADQVRFRIKLTNDHLRGSGSAIPSGLSAALGLEPGDRQQYVGSLGTLAVSWTENQPKFSSIRQVLVALDSSLGDQVMLAFSDTSVEAWKLPAANGNPLAELASLTGVRQKLDGALTEADGLVAIAEALDLPAGSGWAEIAGRATARNETDLIDLVERARLVTPRQAEMKAEAVLAVAGVLTGLESMTWTQSTRFDERASDHLLASESPDWEAASDACMAILERTGQMEHLDELSAQAAERSRGDRTRNASTNAIAALLARPFLTEDRFSEASFELLTVDWRAIMGEFFD